MFECGEEAEEALKQRRRKKSRRDIRLKRRLDIVPVKCMYVLR